MQCKCGSETEERTVTRAKKITVVYQHCGACGRETITHDVAANLAKGYFAGADEPHSGDWDLNFSCHCGKEFGADAVTAFNQARWDAMLKCHSADDYMTRHLKADELLVCDCDDWSIRVIKS